MGVDRRIPSVYDTEKGVHVYTKICQYTAARSEETKATGQLVCVITGDCRRVGK